MTIVKPQAPGAFVAALGLAVATASFLPQAKPPWTESFTVNTADLATVGENPYFILRPGYQLTLEGREDAKPVRLVITVLDETRTIAGIETRVVEERETVEGALAEVSRNFFAIEKGTSSVYYFGEEVDEYERGKVTGHEGAWAHGAHGARFGLMMPGTPVVGMRYYQEYAPFSLVDHDGKVLFKKDAAGAHQDSAFVVKPPDGRWRLLFGNGGIHCLSREGEPLWQHPLGEAQHVVAGRLRTDSPLQFMVVDRTPVPTHRRDANAWAILLLYGLDGRELWRRQMQPGEWCIATRLIRWQGPDQPDCALVYGFSVERQGSSKPARIYNGRGEVVDELPLQVGPLPGETDSTSDCHGMAADV